jgi:hypothetical protein
MHLIVTLLSTLAGVIFAIGGATKASAQELRPSTSSTAVIARQNPSMNSYEMERKRLVNVLAATDAQPPTKPTKDTKPSKKTKSPKKYLP